jgi:hypothetical protein
MRSFRRLIRLAALLLLLATTHLPARACPGCREAVAASSDRDRAERLGRGYSASILLLLAIPTSLAAAAGFSVWHASRRGLLPEL